MKQNLTPNPYNHRWGFCELCETEMVYCGKCGNNCCNGGYGSIDGEKCDACPSAYDMQQQGYFKREIEDTNPTVLSEGYLRKGGQNPTLTYDDEPGSWGRLSEGWPETPFTMGKWLLCTKAKIIPYGSYVKVDGVIRIQNIELLNKLNEAYYGMFEECRNILLKEEFDT